MIGQAMAAKLLEDVLYSRVLECVDVSKLMIVELDLWAALCEQGREEEEARGEAKAMIDGALGRLARDDDRYAALHPLGPFGMECPDCADEARD